MLAGYVSDENYAALADVQVELRRGGQICAVVRSAPSGAILVDVPEGEYEVLLARDGFGSKRVRTALAADRPRHFRLLANGLLGYAWPKWCRGGEEVEFRVHSVEPYKLLLYRHGYERLLVRSVGWYDDHGPRATMQTLPDGHFVETGVGWDNGNRGVHRQRIVAPVASGLYYFHAHTRAGRFTSFPLVVAPPQPSAAVAVLASTNTWNAYNPFGGRSNYILAGGMPAEPIVNSKSDLPRYNLPQYGEWEAAEFPPLSFDRPEPANQVQPDEHATDPIEGRSECHLAPAEWRLLAWLERAGVAYDLYADAHLDSGALPLDAYRVLVLGCHPEYWTKAMYRRTKQWVDECGGRLMYLGGNGINCAVELADDGTMRCLNHWEGGRESRFATQLESEANLLGVIYSDPGAMTSAPYEVLLPEHWVFAGTGLKHGDHFGLRTLHERYGDGASGHETDKVSPSSPPQVTVLAKGLNPDDGGAELVYYETPSGGAVFSAGSITYATALLCDSQVSQITANVLRRWLA